jgi:hypothetical protein
VRKALGIATIGSIVITFGLLCFSARNQCQDEVRNFYYVLDEDEAVKGIMVSFLVESPTRARTIESWSGRRGVEKITQKQVEVSGSSERHGRRLVLSHVLVYGEMGSLVMSMPSHETGIIGIASTSDFTRQGVIIPASGFVELWLAERVR